MGVSRGFKIAVKLNERPAWRIAQQAGVCPSTLSKILSGFIDAKPGDSRVLSVSEVLGLSSEDCFEEMKVY